jgi:cytoskeletal protein CcmA (bactofilin family)
VLKKQSGNADSKNNSLVSISTADLDKLGVNRSSVGNSGTQLIIAPDTELKGKLSVAGSADISGALNLNSKLTASSASLADLQAGNTQLSQLNVNGSSTVGTLNLRSQLIVAGNSQLQGPVTINQLLTVSNNVNIAGNLAVGGTLTVGTFSARSLTSTSTLTIGGHIITSGPSPSVGPGSALGNNGTVSISGNDAVGVIAINIGTGATGGILANVAFHTVYASVPRVIISPVGVGGEFYVTNLTPSGFSAAITGGLPAGGYRINFIAAQ